MVSVSGVVVPTEASRILFVGVEVVSVLLISASFVGNGDGSDVALFLCVNVKCWNMIFYFFNFLIVVVQLLLFDE